MAQSPGARRSFIRAWRNLYNVKQAWLAREAGVHEVSLSRIEKGHVEPGVTNALRICTALSKISGRDVRVEHVFPYSDETESVAWEALDEATDAVYQRDPSSGA